MIAVCKPACLDDKGLEAPGKRGGVRGRARRDVAFAIAFGARDSLPASLLGPIEMVLLLQPGTIQTSSTGLMPSGLAQVPVNVPEVSAWWGTAVPLQVVVLHAATLTFRLGNGRDLLFVP